MMRKGFKEIGFYTYKSQTPIIPIFIGDEMKALAVTNFLKENGVFATPVLPPAVPPGEAAGNRTSYMALSFLRGACQKYWKYLKKAKKRI